MAYVNPRVGVMAAKIVGQGAAMDTIALSVLARAQALASAHVETGNYAASIQGPIRVRGKNGVTDRLIYSNDAAAGPIEWGHVTQKGTTVPGQHIMRRAAGQ